VQSEVILWLAVLPLVLAAFRAVTIGDRLYASVQTGSAGGQFNQLINATLAGLVFVGMLLFLVIGAGGPGQIEDALALILLAFAGFIVSAYMAAGFRSRTWQKFLGHAFYEAAIYWLVLGTCRVMLLLTDRATPADGTAAGPKLQFLEGVVWAVVALVTLMLVIGTAARMRRR
jgi:hypothetical protein